MTILTQTTLLQTADAFIAEHSGLRDVTLSYWIFGDTKKLTRLRGGYDITISRFNAAMSWFATNWPEGSQMPAHLVPYLTFPPRDAAA